MKLKKNLLIIFLAATLILSVVYLFGGQEKPVSSSTQQVHYTDLPMVTRNYFLNFFGMTATSLTVDGQLDEVVASGAQWARNHILWSKIEPEPGVRDWGVLAGREEEWINASAAGIEMVVVVQWTPEWAQKFPGVLCGPMKEENFDEFASFMSDLVARYSQPPYSVRYWEIWNEPDISPEQIDPESGWGCWGDLDDEYFGGGYYAQMLQVVYPAIKAANPAAQVLVGGLLLDCDPVNPPEGKDCKPARFIEGILRGGGGAYFDGISFHAYDYYNGVGYQNGNWHSAWNTTGPVQIAKAAYLRDLLDSPIFGVEGKYLINTEVALLCDACTDDDAFEQVKASYVPEAYMTTVSENLKASLWYTLQGWRNSGLVDANLNPLPAYETYRVAEEQLGGAIYAGRVSDYTNVTGYKYTLNGHTAWLVWSLDGNTHTVNLPTHPLSIKDAFGNALPTSDVIDIDINPIYITFP